MRPALVNQAAGAVIVRNGRPFSVIAFAVTGGKITEIDVIADPDRLHHIAPELINGHGRHADLSVTAGGAFIGESAGSA
jgi:hypothetical protein